MREPLFLSGHKQTGLEIHRKIEASFSNVVITKCEYITNVIRNKVFVGI